MKIEEKEVLLIAEEIAKLTDANLEEIKSAENPENLSVSDVVFGAVAEILSKHVIDEVPAKKVAKNYGVQYVGKKKNYTDHLFGTGLTFKTGQIHMVPASIANKMADHTDMYAVHEDVNDEEDAAELIQEQTEDAELDQEKGELQEIVAANLPHLDMMTDDEMRDFAFKNFGEKFHHKMKGETMKSKLVGLIQSRGLE